MNAQDQRREVRAEVLLALLQTRERSTDELHQAGFQWPDILGAIEDLRVRGLPVALSVGLVAVEAQASSDERRAA